MSRKTSRNKSRYKSVTTSGSPERAITPTQTDQTGVAPTLRGGRQTQPVNPNPFANFAYNFIPRRQWQQFDLNRLIETQLTPLQILELLADVNPEISLAVWNQIRMVMTAWSYTVTTPNGTRELKSAKARLDEFINSINPDSGGIDAIIASWVFTTFLQGAVAGEVVLNETLNDVTDIVAVQPHTIHFSRDGVTQKLIPYQVQSLLSGQNAAFAGYFVRLNPLTFGYIPLDAPPDDAYGRPPAASALQMVVFQMQLLRDLKQAAHVNAWGRVSIEVVEEKIKASVPAKLKQPGNEKELQRYVDDVISSIIASYSRLQPDDAFVHTDSIQINAVDYSGKTFQFDALLKVINAELYRALKQLPVFMGSNEGTTETHGTVQLKIYVSGITSIQKIICALLNKFSNVALRVWGIYGVAKWSFENPIPELKLDQIQADQAEAEHVAYLRDQGWISQDEASIRITGSPAVSPVPLSQMQTNITDGVTTGVN